MSDKKRWCPRCDSALKDGMFRPKSGPFLMDAFKCETCNWVWEEKELNDEFLCALREAKARIIDLQSVDTKDAKENVALQQEKPSGE